MQFGALYPSLKDRGVIITGGGSGIGAEIVRHFAAQGARTVFLDIAEEPSSRLTQDLNEAGHDVHFLPCDLTDADRIGKVVGQARDLVGPLTVLVNNAAHDQRHNWEDVTPDYWDDRIAVNVKHQFFTAQAVIPDMIEAGNGSIINMGSISWMIASGNMVGYTTAKAGVEGLTRSLARDLGPHNIRVNTIAPGWIMTDRQEELWLDEEGERAIAERQCLKRKLVPADIARVVLFFASDEAAACTGETYVVDGGWA
jgi:NAD(P)-dependent dehydrogenase (short-subunit alcohol dehydrogenase family)